MKQYEKKKLSIIKEHVSKLKKPNILELGVQNGSSTKMFLNLCDKKKGLLTSIDIKDCSAVSKNFRWKFILSSDDDFKYISKQLGRLKFDVLFIDSYHEPNHVRNVLFYYFNNYLKKGGIIFIDDISWLPYVKNGPRDNDFVERINRLTFNKLLEVYNANKKNMTLDINLDDSGLAIIKKLGSKLNYERKIPNRLLTIKNILKKIWAPNPKN